MKDYFRIHDDLEVVLLFGSSHSAKALDVTGADNLITD